MLKLEWTSPAISDLKAAGDHINQEAPQAAKRMAERVREMAELLPTQPNIGRPGRIAETRELVVSSTPFIVIYWVRKGVVQILRLLHHAQSWPENE